VVTVVYTDARGIQTADPVPTVAVGLPISTGSSTRLSEHRRQRAHRRCARCGPCGKPRHRDLRVHREGQRAVPGSHRFKTRVTDTYIWINGTTEAGISKVTINGQDFEVSSQFFAVRWNLPIQSGKLHLHVSVRDQAGNQNTYTNRTDVQAVVQNTVVEKTVPFWANRPSRSGWAPASSAWRLRS